MPTNNDPRPDFFAIVDAVTTLTGQVAPADLTKPTPCSAFDVRGLLGHFVGILDRAVAVAKGQDSMALDAVEFRAENDEWVSALTTRTAEASAAWADDATLTQTVVFPWATQDGAECLRMWTNEMVVHGWDVATAIGAPFQVNDDIAAVAFGYIQRALPMADRTPMWQALATQWGVDAEAFPPPFANAVEVRADATPVEKVVAWNGRNPKWTAATAQDAKSIALGASQLE